MSFFVSLKSPYMNHLATAMELTNVRYKASRELSEETQIPLRGNFLHREENKHFYLVTWPNTEMLCTT